MMEEQPLKFQSLCQHTARVHGIESLGSSMLNVDGTNPFAQPHVILVNLAIGGNAGGDASGTHFAVHYVVDYVRVYQQD